MDTWTTPTEVAVTSKNNSISTVQHDKIESGERKRDKRDVAIT